MALPLPAPSTEPAAAAFEARLRDLRRRYCALWRATDDATPRVGPATTPLRRWRNGRATRRLIDRLAAEIRRYPDAEAERRVWRDGLRETVSRFGEQRLAWPSGYRQLVFADAFFDTTAAFSREARAFDPEIATESLMQALRNVWIMNSIQMLLDLEVGHTPAVFAYSMLYPETDNLLDDPAVPADAKRRLGRRLGRRLAGEPLAPHGRAERRIWRLLDRIEGQYPIAAHPTVWCGLRAIHRGQVDSLRQQAGFLHGPLDGPIDQPLDGPPDGSLDGPLDGPRDGPLDGRLDGPPDGPPDGPLDSDRLLEISVAKGGASVLADGYLAAGRLSEGEADFCYGYGVFLQLLDDLQDARADREAGHATLFSTATPPLDRLASRLWRFMHRVVEESPRIAGPAFAARRDLILRNCRTLMVGAVAEDRRLFSRSFRRALERRWPIGFRALSRLRRHAQRRFQQVGDEMKRRRGVDSLFDLIE